MYPEMLSDYERAKDGPVTKGTTIYVAGFDTFVVETDSTIFEVLWAFFQKHFPNPSVEKEKVLRCFSTMNKGEVSQSSVRELTNVMCFGHVLYI